MFDRVRALELIETASSADPFCPACGAHTVVRDHAGHLVLECSTLSEPASRLGRILSFLVPHLRREILDLSEEGLAA